MTGQMVEFKEKVKGNPQKEDGYTPIANEILDVLCKAKIPGSQMQCLITIIRKTYGYNKKQDNISYSQFAEATDLSVWAIRKNLKELEARNIIGVRKNTHRGAQKHASLPSTYWFNKYYEQWNEKLRGAQICTGGVRKNDKKGCANMHTTKDIKQKTLPSSEKSKKKPIKKEKIFPKKIKDFVGSYYEYISKEHPNKLPGNAKTTLNKNSMEVINDLNRLDGFEIDYIIDVMRWAVKDEFWMKNVYSLASLRKTANNGSKKFQNISSRYDECVKATAPKPEPKKTYIKPKVKRDLKKETVWSGYNPNKEQS